MKYPGAKTVMLPDIVHIFRKSGARKFVDVFGGSGVVSLNIGADQVVYNEIDAELVNVFRVVKHNPSHLYRRLNGLLQNGSLQGGRNRKNDSGFQGNRRSHTGNTAAQETGKSKHDEGSGGDPERAFSTIYGFTVSFGGMGETYNTKEKSTYRYIEKTVQQFSLIQNKVASWTIENRDFRDLFAIYASPDTFFYIDPPYYERRWYNHNFRKKDYEDLARIMTSVSGKYLMNIDAGDDDLEDIFGIPDQVRRFENRNGPSGSKPPRLKAFYTNV